MQTIGERLEEARKKKGISIREAAEATKIRGDYLQKFESNHFDIGLAEIYTRGFLRTYCGFLKVPSERILNDYAALGRGDVRPRQPNREIYGKMDISVSTAGESSDRAAPPEEGASEEPASRAQPRYPRGQGNASQLLGPDPAVVFKYIKWGGAAIVVLIVVFALRSCFSGTTPAAATTGQTPATQTAATQTPAATATPRGPLSYQLRATDPVQVRINEVDAATKREGRELYRGLLQRGQTIALEWNSAHILTASALQNLVLIDPNGRENSFRDAGYTGSSSIELRGPNQ